jgi:uncharacterized protein YdaU (DUF1376 family)
MNYYQHHIGDYRRDTSHLSLLEHGIYRQLLDLYYMEEKAIPKETQWVYRRLSAKTQEEQSAVIDVLNDFFEVTEEGYTHKRCDDEIEQYHQKAEKNRQNGKKGGRPPKSKPIQNQGNTESENPEKTGGLISETETKANETLTNNHKPLTNNQYKKTTSAAADSSRAKKSTRVELDFSSWPEHPTDGVLADWKRHRQQKRSPLTQTVVDQFGREAQKAAAKGYTVDEFLAECLARGWQGGKADWLEAKGGAPPSRFGPRNKQASIEEANRLAAEEWLRTSNATN